MDVIEVENVSKSYKNRGKDFLAVNDVSFSVGKGEIFGLLGPNGAGKSTLLNMIVGILLPDTGSIKIFGKDTQKNRDVMETMSLATGETRFHWHMYVKDVLTFYGKIYGLDGKEIRRRTDNLVKFFGLQDVYHRKFGYLSTGERMRLVFAKTLLNYPKLLLLDEPTLGLDPDIAARVREEIKRINKKFGTTIILTSHYMNEVEQLADRIAFIHKGEIVDIGTIDSVKSKKFTKYTLRIRVKELKDVKFLKNLGFTITGKILTKEIDSDKTITSIMSMLTARKVEILDVETKRPSLEDYFIKLADTGEKNEAL